MLKALLFLSAAMAVLVTGIITSLSPEVPPTGPLLAPEVIEVKILDHPTNEAVDPVSSSPYFSLAAADSFEPH